MNELVRFLILITAVLFVSSCKKEDKIAIDSLIGKWIVVSDDRNLAVDGSVAYTFNADKTCIKTVSDFLSGESVSTRLTYVSSIDETLLTLFSENKTYTERYRITKLISGDMEWINASPKDGNSDKKLRKQ